VWFDIKELSAYLKIKEKTLYSFVSKGLIPHYRIAKLVRFRKDEIDLWMETKRAKSTKSSVDKIVRSYYNSCEGKPDRLNKKEVA
jgi:excisionase family DNA binding protein